MNWVGGTRSRLRQNAERKIQKEFFERKRLVKKVNRIQPPLSKVKAGISQDLLYLQATASSTKSKPIRMSPVRMPKPLSLEPRGGHRGGGQQPMARRPPQRDIEFPMSPIGHSSTLEFMDTNTVLSETFDKGRDSGGGSEREPPRVSTQKIPHKTLLESFGPPKIKDVEFGGLHQLQRKVPSLEGHLSDLNVSTMTESLFPPPAKRHRHHHGDHKRGDMERKPHTSRKYSLDELLEQDPLSRDHSRITRPEKGHAPFPPGGVSRPSQEDRRRVLRGKDVGTKKKSSLFSIAKRGWQAPPLMLDREKARTDYNFSSWAKSSPGGVAAGNVTRQRGMKEKLSSWQPWKKERVEDGSVELVLQYADVDTEKGKGVTKSPHKTDTDPPPLTTYNHQLVPRNDVTDKNLPLRQIDAAPPHEFEKENLDPWGEMPRKLKAAVEASSSTTTPWVSSMKSESSMLTENPLSRRNMPPVLARPPVPTTTTTTSSTDFDESIFGPLQCRVDATKEGKGGALPLRKKNEQPQPVSLDTTQFNESVLAPIRRGRKHGAVEREIDSPQQSSSSCFDITQFNESVLAPIMREKRHGGVVKQLDSSPWQSSFSGLEDVTSFNESVLAPIVAARKVGKGREGSCEDVVGGFNTSLTTTGAASAGGGKRKRSTFEIMMESLEKSCESEEVEKDNNKNKNLSKKHQQVPVPPPPATFVPSHTSYKCKEPCLPMSGEIPTTAASEGLKQKARFYSKGNISVLHELMCLEEEISSLTEDGLITQASPVEIDDVSEEPIFSRVAVERPSECAAAGCLFDSSQEEEKSCDGGGARKLGKHPHHQLQGKDKGHASLRPQDSALKPCSSSSQRQHAHVHVACGSSQCPGLCDSSPKLRNNSSPRNSSPVSQDSIKCDTKSPVSSKESAISNVVLPDNVGLVEVASESNKVRSTVSQTVFKEVADSSVQVNGLTPKDAGCRSVCILPHCSTAATQTKGNSEPNAISILSVLQPKNVPASKSVEGFQSATVGPLSTTDATLKQLEPKTVEWNVTSENLTMGLELYRPEFTKNTSERKQKFAVSSTSHAVQVSTADLPETEGTSSVAAGDIHRPQEVEVLRKRVQQLEEKLLQAESAALWQSLVIRLYQQDSR